MKKNDSPDNSSKGPFYSLFSEGIKGAASGMHGAIAQEEFKGRSRSPSPSSMLKTVKAGTIFFARLMGYIRMLKKKWKILILLSIKTSPDLMIKTHFNCYLLLV